MDNWTDYPNADPLPWLLEDQNPSVRYWTLKNIIEVPERDPALLQTRERIVQSPPIRTILKQQHPDGYWGSLDSFYRPKYRATYHQLLILSALGTPRVNSVEKAVELMFEHYQYESGHFSMNQIKTQRGKKSKLQDGICLAGNMVGVLIHFGYLHDERTQRAINFICQTHEHGWSCRAYPIDKQKVSPLHCYMGGIKPLQALSMIPESERTQLIRDVITEEIEIYLENEIFLYLKDENGKKKEKPGWKRFGFPLFYQSDALEVCDILTRLGVRDWRMKKALDLILEKQTVEGKWNLEHTFNGKMWTDIEEKGNPSKWITLKAVRVLKRFYER
ncbi:MAG: nitrogen fixation protein NifH [Theionarchaea archaeon]|nr:nitrogen fixation protein NifH [Theionarchaea archaeon]